MPYKNIERRRAAGRAAQERYRRRHPDRVAAYTNSDKARETRRAWKARNRDRIREADRAAHQRLRQAQRTAGVSPALDRMRADLKACFDPATRQRLIEAIQHMEKVIAGGTVKPRGPRPGRDRLRPIPRVPFR